MIDITADIEFFVQIVIGKTVKFIIKGWRFHSFPQMQRVQIRIQMPAVTMAVYPLQHFDQTLADFRINYPDTVLRIISGKTFEIITHLRMRLLKCGGFWQRIKNRLPTFIDRIRVTEIIFVKIFNIRLVGAA